MKRREKEEILDEFTHVPETVAEEALFIYRRVLIEVLVDIRDSINLVGEIIEDGQR